MSERKDFSIGEEIRRVITRRAIRACKGVLLDSEDALGSATNAEITTRISQVVLGFSGENLNLKKSLSLLDQPWFNATMPFLLGSLSAYYFSKTNLSKARKR